MHINKKPKNTDNFNKFPAFTVTEINKNSNFIAMFGYLFLIYFRLKNTVNY